MNFCVAWAKRGKKLEGNQHLANHVSVRIPGTGELNGSTIALGR